MYRFLLTLLLRKAFASSCDAEPLVLPLQDVQVLLDVSDSFMKGIPAEIGTPPQNLVLLPWADLNNTWIYAEPFCKDSGIPNDESCKVRRGGIFNEEKSTSFTGARNIVKAGGAPNETFFKGGQYGVRNLIKSANGAIDSFTLQGSTELEKFPFGIPTSKWDDTYSTLSPLGLGRNSTYLNALRKAGKIGSRVWSIFWGRMWIKEPLDGSLILGGYDEKKVTGKNYTAPLVYGDFDGSDGCWTGMKVTLTDIQINYLGGTNVSIFPKGTTLQCCIDPANHLLLEAPTPYIRNFESVSGLKTNYSLSGLHWNALQTGLDKQFLADLTFHLDSGLKIRVPNNQYMIPTVDIASNGSRTSDASKRDILITDFEDEPPILGRYFLTAAYLMVNHDAGTFTLWQANATRERSLVRVFDEETGKKCENATGVIQTSAPYTGSASESSRPDIGIGSNSGSLSGAAIGGAVVGAVAGAVLIGLGIAYFLIRKKLKADTYYFYPAHEELQRADIYEMDGNPRVDDESYMKAEIR
ncbi:aspartic peptidase domain-containing protein [Fusarium sp. MPI-SDFR-AT-0072]|nr:aspartic peptidase domain-containing protein [Fusarium sp. MPI-SDFR-AT-0072]